MAVASTIIAAGIGAAGAIGGAALANKGAKSAASAQTKAADQANATQEKIYNQQRADAEPWRQVGGQALDLMGSLYGFTPTFKPTQPAANANTQTQQYAATQEPAGQYQGIPGKGNRFFDMNPAEKAEWSAGYEAWQQQQAAPQAATQQPAATPATGAPGAAMDPMAWLSKMPGYQFRLKEGTNALNTGWAANGMRESGAAEKALLRYGQDYASGEFNNEWNRLAGLAGVGQAVNNSNNQLATNYGNNVSQNQLAAGAAKASSYAQQGQTNANLFGGLAGIGANIASGWGGGKIYNKGY